MQVVINTDTTNCQRVIFSRLFEIDLSNVYSVAWHCAIGWPRERERVLLSIIVFQCHKTPVIRLIIALFCLC